MISTKLKKPLPVVETESGKGKKISTQAIKFPIYSLSQSGVGFNAPLINIRRMN